jgi:DNA topoisomerase-1
MPTPIKSLGPHPSDGQPVNVFSGRYGPYVSHGGVNATIRDVSPEEVTLEQAIALLAARPQPKGKRSATPKAPRASKARNEATAPAEARAPKQSAAAPEAAAPKTTNGKKTTPKPKGKAAKKKKASRRTEPAEG